MHWITATNFVIRRTMTNSSASSSTAAQQYRNTERQQQQHTYMGGIHKYMSGVLVRRTTVYKILCCDTTHYDTL